MRLGSLFDGSGGFPLAGTLNGIEPVWASEIEPFPVRVTKARFPQMKHLDDVTKISGAEAEKVAIVTFGSPCQDLSVAGAQKGIHEGARSSLFFEAVRIIREMRDDDRADGRTGKHIRPRWAVWENVPGAFSSNGGEDFRAVLQALAEVAEPGVSVPRPEGGRWNRPGCIMGRGWSIAWRILDAKYWGVPQRRKRIYLVADFAGERAGEILFEREGVSGDNEPGGAQREDTAGNAGGGAEGGREAGCLNPWDSQTIRQYDANGIYPTLTSSENSGLNRAGVVYPTVARCLTAEHDASPCLDRGQNVVAAFLGGQGAKARSIAWCENGTTPTLRSAPSGGNTVPDVCYAIEGNTIDRDSGKNGCGYCKDVSPTLNTQDRNGVAYTADCRNGALNEELSGTLQAKPNGGQSLNCINQVVYDQTRIGQYGPGKTASTLMARGYKSATDLVVDDVRVYPGVGITSKENASNPQFMDPSPTIGTDSRNYLVKKSNSPRKYIVRRLTPTECARLQGFPDWWDADVEGSDSARYKMWGNGIALPCAEFVLRRIAEFAEIERRGW